jgi:hypothetical protein
VRVQMVKIVTTPKHWLLISTCRDVCIANSKTCASLTSITRHLHWLDELCLYKHRAGNGILNQSTATGVPHAPVHHCSGSSR